MQGKAWMHACCCGRPCPPVQAVFEALIKTMPCMWRNKSIVVLDCVHVAEPYTEAACSADADHQATLDRVRKVLSAERVKLGLATK